VGNSRRGPRRVSGLAALRRSVADLAPHGLRIRHFAPAMIAARRGVIVNFSSGWGRSTDPEVAPYCASKWGIEGLTSALAQEIPHGLAAVSLNPGVINTEMLRSCFGASASSYLSPDQWAKTAVPFLLKLGPGDNGKQLEAPNSL